MCRFAIGFSKVPFAANTVVEEFAHLSKKNPAPDGDEQEDGWGVVYQYKDQYYMTKSTSPIWEDRSDFIFPAVNKIFIHSRSATFYSQKRRLDLNQPFVSTHFVYVFNGRLKGVKLPFKVWGNVGAARLLSLIERFYFLFGEVDRSILKSIELLRRYSQRIYGLNFAVFDQKKLYVYSICSGNEEYYRLFYAKSKDYLIVSSAPGIFRQNNRCIFLKLPTKYKRIEFGKLFVFDAF